MSYYDDFYPYINQPKEWKTDEERIKYLEAWVREMRRQKEQLYKEVGRLKAENRNLKADNQWLRGRLEMLWEDTD